MARSLTTIAQFAEQDDHTPEAEQVEHETVVNDDFVNARVKGTWTFYYGGLVYDFKDGQRYKISRDTFNYLKKNGNIYDTMA
jgi:hypothetical protein